MATIRNKRPWAVEIAATGQNVDPGSTVEVDDTLAVSLCEQEANWERVAPEPKAATEPEPPAKRVRKDEED